MTRPDRHAGPPSPPVERERQQRAGPLGRRAGKGARWAALGAIGVVLVLAVAFTTRFGTDPDLVASPLVGRPAPDLALPYLEEPGELDLGSLRGEVVVINFWASWCLECRLEHPHLVAAAEAYREAGVRFVGILYNDRSDQAVAMLDELGRGYTYVTDPGSRAAIEFGVFGVPETFLIDRQGVIVGKITGPSTYPTLAEVLNQVLVGERPGARTTGTVQSSPEG